MDFSGFELRHRADDHIGTPALGVKNSLDDDFPGRADRKHRAWRAGTVHVHLNRASVIIQRKDVGTVQEMATTRCRERREDFYLPGDALDGHGMLIIVAGVRQQRADCNRLTGKCSGTHRDE